MKGLATRVTEELFMISDCATWSAQVSHTSNKSRHRGLRAEILHLIRFSPSREELVPSGRPGLEIKIIPNLLQFREEYDLK